VLRLLAELIPCLLGGLLLGLRLPGLAARLAAPLVSFGVPLSVAALLLRAGLRRDFLAAGLLTLFAIGLALLALRRLEVLRRSIRPGSLQLGAVVGNTAYFGIPAVLALLPPAAIGYAITYDLVGTLVTWSSGPLLIQGHRPGWRSLLELLATSPASRGLAIALPLQFTPWSGPVAAALWIPARIVILLSLFTVGLRLGAMLAAGRPRQPFGPLLRSALLVKLVAFPLAMLLLASLAGLPPIARDAVVLQAAAPTAISVLLLSEAAARDVEEAAGLVLWSTLFALGTVPLWGWLLHGPLAAGWPAPGG
jgi:predicted permease